VVSPDCSLAPSLLYSAYVDVDDDGDIDRVATGQDSFSVSRNLGSGQFAAPEVYASNTSLPYVAPAHMNGDGAVDLVVTGASDVRIYLNSGFGDFDLEHTYPAGTLPTHIQTADLNGDGHPDVVLANTLANERTIRVFIHDGVDGLLSGVVYSVYGKSKGIALADLDADGDVDIASVAIASDLVGGSFQGILSILRNNGVGAFGPETLFAGAGGVSVAAGDLDGDGRVDLVLGSDGYSPSILFNQSPCAASDVGACCTTTFQCTLLTEQQCDSIQGSFLGYGQSCSVGRCDPLPTGACCLGAGVCEVLTLAACTDALGAYRGDESTCSANACDPTGACCFRCSPAVPAAPCPDNNSSASSVCLALTAIDCEALHGRYAGDGTDCTAASCVCPGDINADLRTTAADFTILASQFGASTTECRTRVQGDLNCDGVVNAADFTILASDFGCGN
jgi:hypothetical protein